VGLLDRVRGRLGAQAAPTHTPAPAPASLLALTELTVYGADWCGDVRRAREQLDAAGVAYRWVDIDEDLSAKAALVAAGLPAIPVIAAPDGRVLMEPSNAELRDLIATLG
jgi:mycoredoxin